MYHTNLLPKIIGKVLDDINKNSNEITTLDKAIGDGDHVVNLQRGLNALQDENLVDVDWATAWKKIGMTLMSKVGGASGSLLATLFLEMSKKAAENSEDFSTIYAAGVDAMKQRGKSEAGEKTMLDVLIPVSDYLSSTLEDTISTEKWLNNIKLTAIKGMESTHDMIATKGRAAFLGERSIGIIDAGACSCQVMICAIVDILLEELPT